MTLNDSDSFYDSKAFHENDVIMITLTKSFMHDPSIIVLNKVPYINENEPVKEQHINYALVSTKSEDPIAIAILVKPEEPLTLEANQMLESAVQALTNLKWIPLVFSEEELWFKFSQVKHHLDSLIYMEKKDEKVTKLSSSRIRTKGLTIEKQSSSKYKILKQDKSL